MRIAVDLTPIYDHLTGIERYNINIIQSLIKAHSEENFVLVFKNEVHKEFKEYVENKNVEVVIIPGCNKLVFLQYRLLKAMNKIEADYYLFLSFTSPYFFKKKKTISAIHDLTCWDCPDSIPTKMKYYYRLTYKRTVKKDWKTITVSKFSQDRICERFNIKKEDVPVIFDGLSDIFKNNQIETIEFLKGKYSIPGEYILSLSTIEPRKNLQLLILAYQQLIDEGFNVPELVLAGRKGWKLEEIFKSIPDDIQKKIHFTDFVEEEDLPSLYANARLFVFPSKYEGFGLPIIEAMSQGTLVLSSNAASLPEVVEDNGILFESDNADDLKEKIKICLNIEYDEKRLMTESARENALKFDWNVEAEKLYSILKNDFIKMES